MTMTSTGGRAAGAVLTAVIIELTVATAYIHFTLGGTIFLLNAVGYAVLGTTYVIAAYTPIAIVQRVSWLPGVCLAVYALVTIGTYLAIGPYFALGWIAKGIEVAIIALIAVELLAFGSYPDLLLGDRQMPAVDGREKDRDMSERATRGTTVRRPASSFPPVAGIGAIVLVFLVVTTALLVASRPAPDPSSGAGTGAPDITISSRYNSFTSDTIMVPAAEGFALRLINEDDVPHNVAIYRDSSASESLFVGELITADVIVYEVPSLEAGTYYFRCDLHPEMNGTLEVQG